MGGPCKGTYRGKIAQPKGVVLTPGACFATNRLRRCLQTDQLLRERSIRLMSPNVRRNWSRAASASSLMGRHQAMVADNVDGFTRNERRDRHALIPAIMHIEAAAAAAEISKHALLAAADALGVVTRRGEWRLPG